MNVSEQTVRHIARLARLELADGEVEAYRRDLSQILGYVDQLQQVDTEGVEPTAHAVPTQMRLREDVAEPRLSREDVLMNAPAHEDGMFRVPKVVEG